jgi:hypothetical protein
MKVEVKGIRELRRKLTQIQIQLDTTVEIQFDLFLNTLIANIQRRISQETGPNAPLYGKAKEYVFGDNQPYKVTGSLIKNIQNVKLPSPNAAEKIWSFGVQPITEDTYSINLIFEMFRTGQRGLTPDIHKLSTEIAQELEDKYPNFKFFEKVIGPNASVIRDSLIAELDDIILNIVSGVFNQ